MRKAFKIILSIILAAIVFFLFFAITASYRLEKEIVRQETEATFYGRDIKLFNGR